MTLPFYDNMPGPERRDKFNQMWQLFQQAVEEAVGPQGWSPKLSLVSDGSRRVLQIVDWVGGEGTKPTTSGYIGATGIVATAALAVDIRGSTGAAGPSNTLAIGTVTSGASPSATITGASPNQTLNLVLPKGDKGDTGNTGPANTLTIGTVTTGSASATITGTAPAQVLNLTIPQGIQGIQGPQGPKGDTGNTGATGPQGIQGVQGVNGDAGWSPIFATVADGVRYVLQVTDWAGGAGTKPAVGKYVGATGFVDTIASGVNIRGPAGTGSVSPSGTIAADDLAAFVDSLGTSIKAVKPADLPVSTATQTALNGKQASLGFTPVRQGGATGQGPNTVYIGWATDASGLLCQVDTTNFGNSWPINIAKNAATATNLATARTINGVSFDGTANITVADSTKLPLAGGTMTGAITFAGTQTWPTFNQSTTGNAATATKLATARTINGVSFDGSANISVSVAWSSVTGKPAVIAAGADAAAARAAIGAGTSNLADAPSDGKTYGRKNAAWAEVAAGATYRIGDVQIAPTAPATGTWLLCDGSVYLQSSYSSLFSAIGIRLDAQGLVSVASAVTGPGTFRGMIYAAGLYVAFAYTASSTIYTSPDGINWTARTLPVSMSMGSLAYGAGLFVGVAEGSSVSVTSPDGINWTQRAMPSSQNWQQCSFNNGLFTVTSLSAAAATSTNGISWTSRSVASAIYTNTVYGAGLFVRATGATPYTSPDGINWTPRTAGTTNWFSTAYGNGIFVMVGGTSSSFTSPDGINWTARTLPSITGWRTVIFSSGLFIAIGSGNVGASSSDGITWTVFSLPSSGEWRIAAVKGTRLIVGKYSSTEMSGHYLNTSYDPETQFIVPRAISADINSWIKAL